MLYINLVTKTESILPAFHVSGIIDEVTSITMPITIKVGTLLSGLESVSNYDDDGHYSWLIEDSFLLQC